MTVHYQNDRATIYHGDCIEVMRSLPDNSVDAVVTDPPYLLDFMGKGWDAADGIAGKPEVWREALRILKPGGHLLAFGGTRTWHRLAVAIEDAGFDIRDNIAWQHSSPIFCQCSAVPYVHDNSDLHGVRQDLHDTSGMAQARQESDMQSSMQRQGAGSGLGDLRAQGSGGVDGRESQELRSENVRREQSGLEGRGDLLAQGGELSGDQIRQGTRVGGANGAQRRLHHGTPSVDGNDVRSAPDAQRSSEPHQPQSAGQHSDQSGVVPDQRGSQTWRGWPICSGCGKPVEPPFSSGPLAWQYGSGFPKSLDVSKAIDKNNGEVGRLWKFTSYMRTTGLTAKQLNEATGTFMGSHYLTDKSQPAIPTPELWQIIRPLCGEVPAWVDELVRRIAAEREVVGSKPSSLGGSVAAGERNTEFIAKHKNLMVDITAPATPAAQQWQGWGTALKPAFEPIVVARKPLIGTVAQNVLTHGTGALNIDGCRIGTDGGTAGATSGPSDGIYGNGLNGQFSQPVAGLGRWPANVILDESQAAELDAQSGVLTSGQVKPGTLRGLRSEASVAYADMAAGSELTGYGDTGGASRFFYCPKAGKKERPNVNGVAHPTVKPMKLMEYLCRLVTPPGGTILEPFAGSGTTIEAALNEGFNVIGIEMTDEYLPLIMARIERYGDKLC